MTSDADFPRRRSIRSYVVRAGRMGPGQVRALQALAPSWVLPYRTTPLDTDEVFGRHAPVVLEIGFGMGAATAAIAEARPGTDFIGVEVLEHMVAPASLAGVHIYFPDPWHKTRHHKRRLVQPAFVAALVTRLAPGGYLHCATDWQPYAEQMLAVLGAEPGLVNSADGYAPRPAWRPLTKFEHRGLERGHGVWDLVFNRSS